MPSERPEATMPTVPLPPEDAVKRAISALNVEASRLRLKAADWRRDYATWHHPDIMDSDAAELDEVREYLEQFVTRDPGGM